MEGAPGIGKSTLAWEVCHKWEELESVKQYELVVLVRLREKKAQEARCLGDLLPCDATTNMKELLAAIGEGEGMLIVCDGFDELPREQQQEGSVYIDLLKGRLLSEATVIVTSRPSVSACLWSLCQHNIDRHLEVIGFTKEDIKQFAESVFSGDILAGFLSYITSNPPIYSMMYIPLNAVIVALIYQDNYDTDTPFPTTMTQLFDALTRALIRRHLVSTHQVPSEYCMPPSLQRTEDISKLPPLVGQQFFELARVAYENLLRRRYIVTDLGEDFEHLGMMKKTTSLNVCTGPGCSYAFFHLTFMEYLTALHIAIENPKNFKLVQLLMDHDSVVVRFLAGISRHDDYHSQPAYQYLVECVAPNSSLHVSSQLVHYAYESPSIMDSVKKVMISERAIVVKPVVGLDWYATGYCISHFNERWVLIIEQCIMEENISLLVKGLRSSTTISRPLSTQFQLVGININHKEEVILQQLIAPDIQIADLVYGGMYSRASFILLLFQHPSIQSLLLHVSELLNSADLQLQHYNTNLLKLYISSNLLLPLARIILDSTSLTFLGVSECVRDSDLPILTNIVQSHPSLEEIQFDGIAGDKHLLSSNLRELAKAAINSRLKKLRVPSFVYDYLPSKMHKPPLEFLS